MAKISGTLSDESKIYVINESSGFCENSDIHLAGNYEINNLIQADKTIVAVRVSDGASKSFSNITPIVSSAPMEWDINYPDNEMTFSESNTKITRASGTTYWSYAYSSLNIPTSGKWYIEWGYVGSSMMLGLITTLLPAYSDTNYKDHVAGAFCYAESAVGSVYGMLINRDDNYIKFSKDNTWQTTNMIIPSTPLWFFGGLLMTIGSWLQINCGQHAFNYAPPSGYTAGLYR